MTTGENETSSLNAVGRANITITTNGDYSQISQGKNQQISYQGEQKFAGGPSFNINMDAKTQFLADGHKTWTIGRKFEFNNGRAYRVYNKANYTVGKKTSVENRDYILLTAGQSNKRLTNLKTYKKFIMQVPSWFTYLKYVFKLYRWSQFVTKPIVGKSAVYNNKEMLNAVEGFVNNYISVGIKYFQSLVSVLNTSYFTWLNYEKIFHKPNIPTSILQLSSEKGVFLAGGDEKTLNSIEMKKSIHLSCYNMPRVSQGRGDYFSDIDFEDRLPNGGKGITEEIYKARDEQKETEGLGDKAERLVAKAASRGLAGKYEQYGEYNGLLDKYTKNSYVSIQPEEILNNTKKYAIVADVIQEVVKGPIVSKGGSFSFDAERKFTAYGGNQFSELSLCKDTCLIQNKESKFLIDKGSLSLSSEIAKSSIKVSRNAVTLAKGDKSTLTVDDDKIEISNQNAKITISKNSVNIGSELKVTGMSSSSKFVAAKEMKNQIDQLIKRQDAENRKIIEEYEAILSKIKSKNDDTDARLKAAEDQLALIANKGNVKSGGGILSIFSKADKKSQS